MGELEKLTLCLAVGVFAFRTCACTSITNSPEVTSLHENIDAKTTIWSAVKATCSYTYECTVDCSFECGYNSGSVVDCNACIVRGEPITLVEGDVLPVTYEMCPRECPATCTGSKECDVCSLDNPSGHLGMSGKTIFKKRCSATTCRTCKPPCANDGSIDYSVSCYAVESLPGFSSETASGSYTLTFIADADVTLTFDSKFGASISVAKSISIGSVINKGYSDPVDKTINENDYAQFYKSSSNSPSWVSVDSTSGEITISDSVTSSDSTTTARICVRNRRRESACEIMSITLYDSYVTNFPSITSLHENTDIEKLLWTVTGKCDITYACDSFICSSLVDCDSCSLNNTLFQTNNLLIYKKACLNGLCDSCNINNYCANAGESYSYTISCVKSSDRITTGTASQTASLSFYADVDPPISFDSNLKDSIQIGQSIQGTGQIVNRITSNPQGEPDDSDSITFHISGSKPSWIAVDSNNGDIKVVSSLAAETKSSYTVTFCAENRRHKKTCKDLSIKICV